MGRLDDMRAAAARATGKPPVRPPAAPPDKPKKEKKKSRTAQLAEARVKPEKNVRPPATAEHVVKHTCGCLVGCNFYLGVKCPGCEIKSKRARKVRLRANRLAKYGIKVPYYIAYPLPEGTAKSIRFTDGRWHGSMAVPEIPEPFTADRRTERNCLFELHEKYALWAQGQGIEPKPYSPRHPKSETPTPPPEEKPQ